MLSKEIGNVELLTENIGGFSARALEIAEALQNCNAQKAPWKGYNKLDEDEIEDGGYTRPEEIEDTDYVNWIIVDDIRQTVRWGQGDFAVSCNFRDLEIDTNVLLENYDEDIARVRVGVKANGILIIEDFNLTTIYRVREDGFIGDNEKHNEIEPLIVLNTEITEERIHHESFEEFTTDKLAQVAFVRNSDKDSEELHEWAVSLGYSSYEELELKNVLKEDLDVVCYGISTRVPDADTLTYFATRRVAFAQTSGIEFTDKAIFRDKNRNYWICSNM
jgi:hypothetical protein